MACCPQPSGRIRHYRRGPPDCGDAVRGSVAGRHGRNHHDEVVNSVTLTLNEPPVVNPLEDTGNTTGSLLGIELRSELKYLHQMRFPRSAAAGMRLLEDRFEESSVPG